MKIKGAIFDMDGTLLDSLMFWDHLWKRIGEKYMGDEGFKPDEELNKSFRTMIFVDVIARFRSYYDLSVSYDELFEFAESGTEDFYKNVAKAKEGAHELLKHLKEKGAKLCLASAGSLPEITYALKHHGLFDYFDFVISCVDIGVNKDKPDIYLKAERLMGIPREDICVIEDSYVALETAKNAGFQTVGVFDKFQFGQDRLENASDIYLPEGTALDCLINRIEVK